MIDPAEQLATPSVLTLAEEPMNLNELDKLAKLLATEDILIEHNPTLPTAYFDTDNRVLGLPVWKNLTKHTYHMLVLHETGHALHTTPEKWKEEILKDKSLKPFLNIVEDARIEKLMKERYPGSRRDFREGYSQLHKRNFFGLDKILEEIGSMDKMSLIDRINLETKIGSLEIIPFTSEERPFLDMVQETRTFDDVIRVAKILHERAKAKNEEQEEQGDGEQDGDGEDGDNGQRVGKPKKRDESGAEGKAPPVGSRNSNTPPDPHQDDGIKPTDDVHGSQPQPDPVDETVSQTMQAFEDALNAAVDPTAKAFQYVSFDPRTYDMKDYILPYQYVLEQVRTRAATQIAGSTKFAFLRRKNIKMVDYLAKEFEMRKQAEKFVKQRSAKTGVINPNKLHSYTLVDDIFKRNTILPEGKNHGICMFIDFSGSMSGNMADTISQLMNLTLFCRKVKIPHRVYAFSDSSIPSQLLAQKRFGGAGDKLHALRKNSTRKVRSEYVFYPDKEMTLIELFNEKMKISEFRDMMEGLLFTFTERHAYGQQTIPIFGLHSTPLDGCILASHKLLQDFRTETRADIISAVFLTDGDSSGVRVMNTRQNYEHSMNAFEPRAVFRNCQTGHTYMRDPKGSGRCTDAFLTSLKDSGFNVIGYRVGTDHEVRYALQGMKYDGNRDKAYSDMRKDGATTLNDHQGYEQYHIMKVTRETIDYTKTPDDEDDFEIIVKPSGKVDPVTGNPIAPQPLTKGNLAKAFSQARSQRMNSRKVLTNFASKIAEAHKISK